MSPGGFDDSTLPLVDKSLGEYDVGLGVGHRNPSLRFKSVSSIWVH